MVVVLWLLVVLACLCADLGADVGLASGVKSNSAKEAGLAAFAGAAEVTPADEVAGDGAAAEALSPEPLFS
jgi:hypothetical protein